MAGESDKDVDIAEKSAASTSKGKSKAKKKKGGFLSRIWNSLFGPRNDDFERRLERISKEEAAVLSRLRKRSQSVGRIKRHLILFSLLLELVAVCYALITASSVEDQKRRAFRVLPIIILPALSYLIYKGFVNIMTMCEEKDLKTLEKLRAERQSKIDELKEKTNYYITQQLIQRYDTDPAAKEAAARVLASKLGAESGLKVFVADDINVNTTTGRSNDVELSQADGLRNRKQPRSRSAGNSPVSLDGGTTIFEETEAELAEQNQPAHVDHYRPSQAPDAYVSGGWLARLAAMLVGEDPTQCYALICGNCHMHNGLASKEDFPYVTYICPHCRAVNGPRNRDSHAPGSSTQTTSASTVDNNNSNNNNNNTATDTNQSPGEGAPDSQDGQQTTPSPETTGRNDTDDSKED